MDSLSNLRDILGTPDKGLKVRDNDLLTDVKGLENLASITDGGVDIWANDNLCYLDLMHWERMLPENQISLSVQISYFQKPASCLTLQCDSDCDCGYCGGPGPCAASCDEGTPGWIAAPIILGLICLGLLIWLIYACVRGSCRCACSVTRRPMVFKSHTMPFDDATTTADPWVGAGFDRSALQPPGNLPKLLDNSDAHATEAFPMAPVSSLPDSNDEPEEQEPAAEEEEEVFCICGKPAEFDCSRCAKQSYCSNECQVPEQEYINPQHKRREKKQEKKKKKRGRPLSLSLCTFFFY